MIKAIALDFDNCIILDEETRTGSEELKDEAWFDVFHEYGRADLQMAIEQIKVEIAGGKGDRRDVAEYICRKLEVVPKSLILPEVDKRCEKYNQMLQEGIEKIGVSKQTRQTLNELLNKIPLYINTATPESAIRESLDALALTKYFKGILGRPGTKVENLKTIFLLEKISGSELLFVADRHGDFVAAREAGCQFVGMHTAQNTTWHAPNKLTFPVIYSLAELIPFVKDFQW